MNLIQRLKFLSKRLAYLLASLLALPVVVPFYGLQFIVSRDSTVATLSQFLSLFPGLTGVYFRKAALRFFLKHCHWQSHIGFGVVLSHADTEINDGVYIGPHANIGKCRLEKNVLLGSGVHVISGNRQHRFDDLTKPIREQQGEFEKVTIGEDCWVGNSALIMADVGRGCVVAAGTVVNKRIPDYAVVAGNPAKIIRMRNKESVPNEINMLKVEPRLRSGER